MQQAQVFPWAFRNSACLNVPDVHRTCVCTSTSGLHEGLFISRDGSCKYSLGWWEYEQISESVAFGANQGDICASQCQSLLCLLAFCAKPQIPLLTNHPCAYTRRASVATPTNTHLRTRNHHEWELWTHLLALRNIDIIMLKAWLWSYELKTSPQELLQLNFVYRHSRCCITCKDCNSVRNISSPVKPMVLGGCTVYYVWEPRAFMTPPKNPMVYERLYV